MRTVDCIAYSTVATGQASVRAGRVKPGGQRPEQVKGSEYCCSHLVSRLSDSSYGGSRLAARFSRYTVGEDLLADKAAGHNRRMFDSLRPPTAFESLSRYTALPALSQYSRKLEAGEQ